MPSLTLSPSQVRRAASLWDAISTPDGALLGAVIVSGRVSGAMRRKVKRFTRLDTKWQHNMHAHPSTLRHSACVRFAKILAR